MDIIKSNIPQGYCDPKNPNDIIRAGGRANFFDEEKIFHSEIEKELGAINIEDLKKMNGNYSDFI